jgi:glucoamylase
VWQAQQLDEVALPVVPAWLLHRTDLAAQVRKSADYLMTHGPRTEQARWEEAGDYSPATIAAEIAALVCAADTAPR